MPCSERGLAEVITWRFPLKTITFDSKAGRCTVTIPWRRWGGGGGVCAGCGHLFLRFDVAVLLVHLPENPHERGGLLALHLNVFASQGTHVQIQLRTAVHDAEQAPCVLQSQSNGTTCYAHTRMRELINNSSMILHD